MVRVDRGVVLPYRRSWEVDALVKRCDRQPVSRLIRTSSTEVVEGSILRPEHRAGLLEDLECLQTCEVTCNGNA